MNLIEVCLLDAFEVGMKVHRPLVPHNDRYFSWRNSFKVWGNVPLRPRTYIDLPIRTQLAGHTFSVSVFQQLVYVTEWPPGPVTL